MGKKWKKASKTEMNIANIVCECLYKLEVSSDIDFSSSTLFFIVVVVLFSLYFLLFSDIFI